MSSLRVTVGQQSSADIVKQGCLKKLKTMRKKYFVLRGDSADTAACIEYYDSEKKFRSNQPPKRSITLKTCFNINKRTDTRHKWVIALYTKKDCFCIVLENEEEMEDWLKALLELQLGEAIPEGEPVRPNFEHVWRVTVLSKELGSKKNILGPYLLCLTDQVLSLVKATNDDRFEPIEFSLQKIRRCGHFDTFFYMELGQCTVTGPGNLWMQTEDTNIAENMHTTILNAMRNCTKKDLQPKSRTRSSSANEASKPTSLIQRLTHTGISNSRERSDSMPSRHRTTSENAHFPHLPQSHVVRPHSMYNKAINNYSPPVVSSPVSPSSVACSTDSAESSLSMDGDVPDGPWEESGRYSLTPDEPVILEENSDDYGPWPGEDEKLNNYMPMEPSYCLSIQSNSTMNRKHSPNPSSSGFKSSSPSQGSGMDMYSPYSSSPLDTPGNYLPMSPGDNRYLRNTVNHSRGSSLTDDGYVPMAPPASDDGYVDMDQGSVQNNEGSCGSITSGTPSTDIRFSEYALDKVSAFFPPNDADPTNDLTPNERPARAYSVGSRPSPNVNRSDLLSSSTCERVRAFSVGSRNVHVYGRIPPSSSHSSMEPCDDMMELDFSKKGRRARKKVNSSERLSVPGPGSSASTLSSAASSYSTAEGSYMEMSPPKKCFGKSPPKSSPPLGRVPEGGEGYMEMKPGDPKHIVPMNTKARVDSFPVTSPPIKPFLLSGRNKDDYLDMSLKRKMSITEDNNNTKVMAPQPDEYVEMTLGTKSDQESSYMVMNMGSKERRGSRRGSQPITIQGPKEPSSLPIFALSGGRKHSTGTPPKGPLHLSLSGSPRWSHKSLSNNSISSTSTSGSSSRRDDQGIFPFSPDGYEPPAKCPVDATSGELRIYNEEEDDDPEVSPMDRLLSGLGNVTIMSPKEDSNPPVSTLSPNGKKELHYASLDLVKSGSESEESSRTVRTATESSSSPSPSLPSDTSPFNYAEIDFAKCANKSLH